MGEKKRAQACHVLADVGGTHARFAIVRGDEPDLHCLQTYDCADYGCFEDVVAAYFATLAAADLGCLHSACFAIAAPVHEDAIVMINSPWRFSRRALARRLGMPLTILNDFTAQAWCLPSLQGEQVLWLQGPHQGGELSADIVPTSTVVGPGTGFGGATVMPSGEVLESEPGHVSFAPRNPHERDLLTQLWRRYDRVCVEHLLSGPGLANLYWANKALEGRQQGGELLELCAAQILAGARAGDPLCLRSIGDFTAILGSVCGDIALSMGSRAGFYLSGDILRRLDELFDRGLFIAGFTDKGPFSDWCRQVPVGLIGAAYPGLLGCAIFCRARFGED